jgi:hypothetical protein
MSSHVLSSTHLLCASPPGSRPGGALERIKVRGSTLVLTSLNPHPTLSQTHSFALTGAGASVSPSGREKGEANVAVII